MGADPLGILKGKGEEIYSALVELGKDQILAVLKTSPPWAQLSGRLSEVEAWVNAFLEYGLGDGGEETPTVPGVAAC